MLGQATTEATEDQREFLQHRVARFGLMVGGLFLGFLAFRVVVRLLSADPTLGRSHALHLLTALSFLGAWLISRTGKRSVGALRAIEAGSLLLGALSLCAMALDLPLLERPDFILTITLSLALTARAIYIPSSFRRSLVLALVVGVIASLFVYLNYMQMDRAKWELLAPGILAVPVREIARWQTVFFGAWWLLPGLLSAAASEVIYGLRREIRNARQLGQYHLERKLGEGGMGSVYVARHALLRRPTAIKLIRASGSNESNLKRFEREVQLTASLAHPNTISIFDYGSTPDGIFYYAMELVEGASLASLVQRYGAQPPSRVVHWLEQTALALVEAHEVGLIHRDLKPANLMVHGGTGVEDQLKVVDFGLVKQFDQNDTTLTQEGAITGTPHYMAPESLTAPDRVGPASDLYSLGCVAYYLLTGRDVFDGSSVIEICGQHLHTEPEPVSKRLGQTVHPGLEQLVMSCLAKKPEARPPSAAELAEGLERLDIPRWTRADAKRWWREHAELLEPVSLGEASTVLQTIEIGRRSDRLA